jgi:hypothetical protein
MYYFIFLQNLENIKGSIYRIAENQNDLNNLNIIISDYKIIQESEINFNNVKYGTKNILSYSNDVISYEENTPDYADFIKDNILIKTGKQKLKEYIDSQKEKIKEFLISNKNHLLHDRWNNYYIQLDNLNLDTITFPLNKSLEQYFTDLGQPSFHILQIP